MTDRPIAPDLSGDVPRCSRRCGSYRSDERDADGYRIDRCDADGQREVRSGPSICLPHVRHLKVMSERRCDGCAHYSTEVACYCEWWQQDMPPTATCGDWEPRTNQTPAAVSDGEKRSEDGDVDDD